MMKGLELCLCEDRLRGLGLVILEKRRFGGGLVMCIKTWWERMMRDPSQQDKRQWAQIRTNHIASEQKKIFINSEGDWALEQVVRGGYEYLHLRRNPKLDWLWSWETCSSWTFLIRGVGLDDLKRSLQTSTILWFYEYIASTYFFCNLFCANAFWVLLISFLNEAEISVRTGHEKNQCE